jgi:hypothetical protein
MRLMISQPLPSSCLNSTRSAVETRYPEEIEPITPEEVAQAIELAERSDTLINYNWFFYSSGYNDRFSTITARLEKTVKVICPTYDYVVSIQQYLHYASPIPYGTGQTWYTYFVNRFEQLVKPKKHAARASRLD